MQDQQDYIDHCKQKVTSLLKQMIAQAGAENPKLLFTNAWRVLFADAELMLALSQIKIEPFQFFQFNNKERLHFLIVWTMNAFGIQFIPNIALHGDQDIKSAIKANTSSLFLTVHDGFAFQLATLLHYGQKVSFITSAPNIENLLMRTGIRPDQVEMISKDFRSLERLRSFMTRGVIPVNTIDYLNKNGVFDLINPTFFKLAIKKNYSVFFAKREIGDDGVANIYTTALNTTLDPILDAQLFIDFQSSQTYSPDRRYALSVE
jgi:hypothetical protein